MKSTEASDPMRGVRRVLGWAVIPTVLYMLYAAITGSELPSLSRRPGPHVPITWSETPIQFLISGIAVYAAMAFAMLILYGLVQLVLSKR